MSEAARPLPIWSLEDTFIKLRWQNGLWYLGIKTEMERGEKHLELGFTN